MTDLPPAGWYDDPTSPVQERWWDGEKWSEQIRRKERGLKQRRQGELRDLGDFLGHTFSLIRARWDDFLLVSVVAGILLALLAVAVVRPIIVAIDIVNDELVGWGATQTWQVLIFVGVSILIYVVASMAHHRLAWDAATDTPGGWAAALQFGIAAAPRMLGWAFIGILPILGGFLLFIVLARSAVGLGVLSGLAVGGAALWWAIVIALIPIALVVQRRGANPILGAWSTVRGRWWAVFGRILLIQFLVGLVVQVVGALVGQVVGAGFFGIDVVDAGNGRFEIVKDLGSHLDFFMTTAVFSVLSIATNIGQVTGIASIAYDVMEREDSPSVDTGH